MVAVGRYFVFAAVHMVRDSAVPEHPPAEVCKDEEEVEEEQVLEPVVQPACLPLPA